MAGEKGQNYLHGAAILTFGVFIIKILGAIYKIPLGNILGTQGFAYFTVAYNIYNFLLTLSTAGLPVALSRMISEAHTLGRPAQVKRVFNVAWMTFFILGTVGSLVMFLFPTDLAVFMGNAKASQSIWAMSPSVLLVCLMSAYRGYTQGHSDMKPTTVSQVIEVAVKVVVGLVLALLLAKYSKSDALSSAGAIFGVTVGSIVALIYLYVEKKRAERIYLGVDMTADTPDSTGVVFSKLLKVGIPIALGSSLSSLITLIDTKLVLNRLELAAGFVKDDAAHLFGVYSEAITMFNLPAAFITPLTISVVPAIAACAAVRKKYEAKEIAESSMRIATIVAIPMGIGLFVLAEPIMAVIYPNSGDVGAPLLAIMGISSYFVCMALMSTAILQAYGCERLPVYSMVIGGIVKIAVNWILVGNPSVNIYGAPIGTLCCYIVMCVSNYIFLCRSLVERPSLKKILLRPFITAAAMGAGAWAVYGLCEKIVFGGSMGRMPMLLSMAASICVAVIVYVVLVIALRAVTLDDMKLIPKGEKLASMLHIR